jgi:L-threonylcarbamoyladenylate synthase
MQETYIKQACNTLINDGIILCPTDTIWGLSAKSDSSIAINKISILKKRIDSKAFILLMSNEEMVSNYVTSIPEIYYTLNKNISQPTTFIFPNAKNINAALATLDNTIAIRIPNSKTCIQIIENLKSPIVSTSANYSGLASPKNFEEIDTNIINAVDYVMPLNSVTNSTSIASSIIKLNSNNTYIRIR